LDERVDVVDRHREEHGLNACLEALSVSKDTWHYRMRDGSKREERRRRDEALKLPVIQGAYGTPHSARRPLFWGGPNPEKILTNTQRLKRL